MDGGTIEVQFRWTADELLRARRYHFKHVCRPVFRVGIYAIFWLMLFAGIVGITSGDLALGIPLTLIGLYFLVIRPFERKWTTRRQFKKRVDCETLITWRFSNQIIETESELGKSEMKWEAIAKVVKTPFGLLLYPSPEIFNWIPLSGFASLDDVEQVFEMSRENLNSAQCFELL